MTIGLNKIRQFIFGFFPFLYPTIEGLFSLLSNGKYLNTFRIANIALLLLCYILLYKPRRKNFFVAVFSIILLFFSGFKSGFSSEGVVFFFFALLLMAFSDERVCDHVRIQIDAKSKCIDWCFLLYLLMIILSLVSGSGLLSHWGTTTITGPYSIPHIIAYGCTGWAVYYFIQVVNSLPNIRFAELTFTAASLILLLLTGTRSALLAFMVFALLVFMRLGWRKRIVIIFAACIGLVILLEYTDFASAVLEKTKYAYEHSTISNGRLLIWSSSIKAVSDFNLLDWLLGKGKGFLALHNYQNIGMEIQAHNDFISALVSYGLVGEVLFLYSLYSLLRGSPLRMELAVFLCVLALTNGLYEYVPFVCFMVSMPSLSLTAVRTQTRKSKCNTCWITKGKY